MIVIDLPVWDCINVSTVSYNQHFGLLILDFFRLALSADLIWSTCGCVKCLIEWED